MQSAAQQQTATLPFNHFFATACPDVHRLYEHCSNKNLAKIGSEQFKPVFKETITTIQRIMREKAKIGECEQRTTTGSSTVFYFGGQRELHQNESVTAARYLEILSAQYIHLTLSNRTKLNDMAAELLRHH